MQHSNDSKCELISVISQLLWCFGRHIKTFSLRDRNSPLRVLCNGHKRIWKDSKLTTASSNRHLRDLPAFYATKQHHIELGVVNQSASIPRSQDLQWLNRANLSMLTNFAAHQAFTSNQRTNHQAHQTSQLHLFPQKELELKFIVPAPAKVRFFKVTLLESRKET